VGAAQKGDWIIFYSPKTSFENGEPLQAFTALAKLPVTTQQAMIN
jgi:hypothetical protein